MSITSHWHVLRGEFDGFVSAVALQVIGRESIVVATKSDRVVEVCCDWTERQVQATVGSTETLVVDRQRTTRRHHNLR